LAETAYEVIVGGTSSIVVAQLDDTLDMPMVLSGQVEVLVDRTQVTLNVQSEPVTDVIVAGNAGTGTLGTTNYTA